MALTKITKSGITDSAVDNNKIEADAVDATKIGDNSISEEHLDITAITGHTELAETAAGTDVLLVYDTSAGALKKILRSNLVLQAPSVSSVSPTSATSGDGTGNYTFTITGSGFTGSSANLINTSGTTVNFDTVTVDSDTQITGVIAKSSLPGSGEPYDVKVTGSNGLATTLENQINIDQSPTYNTAAGSIGTVPDGGRGSTTLTIEAYDPESAGNVTYEIQSGSLPAGATATTVNENGVSKYQISGFSAVGSNTTSNFVLRAVDAASNTSSRAFSITVNAPQSESFTSSSTFSVPSGVTSIDVLVVAGGGAGGYDNGGGGGAGGLIFMPSYPVTPGGTVSVTVGDGGPGGPNVGAVGQDSVFGTLTAKGGGGGSAGASQGGGSGGSGGGGNGHGQGSAPSSNANGPATQPTQPGNSGAYGFGNIGTGGSYPGPTRSGGGGGGAGAAATGAGNYAGSGGAGKTYTIADGTTPVYYAGGGGGGSASPNTSGGAGQGGGAGGGSPNDGSGNSTSYGGDGQANKGGGGGGGANCCSRGQGQPRNGGSGGKGIVIVRY